LNAKRRLKINIDAELWDQAIDDHSSDKDKLYQIIRSAQAQVLWRMAKSEIILSYESIKKDDENGQKYYILEALQHSKMALDLDPNSVDCIKWFCICAGRATALVSNNERIELQIQIKENLDRARALKPNDSMLYFIYGRWSYDVSGLSAAERDYASVYFRTPLESSYSEALIAFDRADGPKPKWKINYLWVAKVLIAQKLFSEALVKIEKALDFETLTEEDFFAQQELIELQNQYKKELKNVEIFY